MSRCVDVRSLGLCTAPPCPRSHVWSLGGVLLPLSPVTRVVPRPVYCSPCSRSHVWSLGRCTAPPCPRSHVWSLGGVLLPPVPGPTCGTLTTIFMPFVAVQNSFWFQIKFFFAPNITNMKKNQSYNSKTCSVQDEGIYIYC